MASTKEFVEFVADQMRQAGEISCRKMFGEYGIYCNGKIIGTVEHDQLYLKITKEGQALMPEAPVESPHKGSNMLRIDDVEDAARLAAMVRATYAALPEPKPKKAPQKKKERAAKGDSKAKTADAASKLSTAKQEADAESPAGEEIALIRLTKENLQSEHICCALSQAEQVQSKKRWLADAMEQGLAFVKGDVRGKCFIEYLPAEAAWAPVAAQDCMYIDCLWVAGQWKGRGLGDRLLKTCIDDSRARGMRGIVVISSRKKRSFLNDPSYLKHRGFIVVDRAEPDFELLYLPLTENSAPKETECMPQFLPQAKEGRLPKEESEAGFVLYYTKQCPFTVKYIPLLEKAAEAEGISLSVRHVDSIETAKACPAPWTTFALFFNGEYLTNEIMTVDKFLKLAREKVEILPH